MADYKNNEDKLKSLTLFNNENGLSYEIPVLNGTEGPDVIDIASFFKQTGMFTYDPGFTSTASCSSSITYIDGHKGILRHRGYDIKDLANNSDFLEVCYLLLHGELPSPADKKNLKVLLKIIQCLMNNWCTFTEVLGETLILWLLW